MQNKEKDENIIETEREDDRDSENYKTESDVEYDGDDDGDDDCDDVCDSDEDVYKELLSYMNGVCIENYDRDVCKFEKNLLECLTKYGINEEVANKMYIVFSTSAGILIAMNIKTILMMIYYLFYGSFIIASSLGISFTLVAFLMKLDNTEMVDFFEKDDEMKRLEFQNSNYEELFNMISLDLDKKMKNT